MQMASRLNHVTLNAESRRDHLVTGNSLGSRSTIRENKISNKRPHGNGKHDHPIVGHEEKPIAG